MKSYLALTCGILLVGALYTVLAAPSSESDSSASSSSSSSSSSEEEPILTFPEYEVDPLSLLGHLPDDLSADFSPNEGEGNDDGSGQPQGRTLFLLLRLLQLLSQSNSTLLG